MRRNVAALAIAAALAATPALAQLSPAPPPGPQFPMGAVQVTFLGDTSGYGRALSDSIMPGRYDQWISDGVATRLGVAQIALRNGDPQPAFAVRFENAEMCDLRFGCLTVVFQLRGRDWKTVLQTRTVALAIGPYDPTSGMAALYSDRMQRWDWDGDRYDIGG